MPKSDRHSQDLDTSPARKHKKSKHSSKKSKKSRHSSPESSPYLKHHKKDKYCNDKKEDIDKIDKVKKYDSSSDVASSPERTHMKKQKRSSKDKEKKSSRNKSPEDDFSSPERKKSKKQKRSEKDETSSSKNKHRDTINRSNSSSSPERKKSPEKRRSVENRRETSVKRDERNHKRRSDEVTKKDEIKRREKSVERRKDDGSPHEKRRRRSRDREERSSRRYRSPDVAHPRRHIKEEQRDDSYRDAGANNHHRRREDRGRREDDTRIKREEDFDRRQEELRRRRLQGGRWDDGDGNDTRRNRTNSDFNDQRERRRNDDRRIEERNKRDREGEVEGAFKKEEKVEKEKPNLGLSGALTADTNTYRGVVIKYNEPVEARVPKKRWRLYPFKGTENLKILHLHRQSAYLLGRLRRIADIPIDHPSCSKQHAVFQFRLVDVEVDGVMKRRVKPYIIDLGSANGTYVNNERIEAQRYVELKEQDLLKFGFSSREYILLHDKADTSELGSEEEEEEGE